MPGRVPHEEVESFYSLIDIAVFPRKPWPVCEMVSPMKPLEALAMEKAVLVSSVRALDEMIKHEETGLVFRKGDIDNLAETLFRLINNPNLRHALGKKGREWVSNERTWLKVGRKIGLILKMGFIND
jgi:glycosyltransferase involved in cell wall biosynthesis